MSIQEALNTLSEFVGLKAYAVAAEKEASISDVYPRNGWVSFKDRRGRGAAVVFDHNGIVSVTTTKDDGRAYENRVLEPRTETVQSPEKRQ